MEDDKGKTPTDENVIRERAKSELTPQARESVLKQVSAFAASLGNAAGSLVDRIRGIKDPEAVISTLDEQLAVNRVRREPLSVRYEKLYVEIAAKKKLYLAAPPAKKKILELELKGLISEYQGLERQLSIYFENERMLNTVRGRTLELTAMGLRKLSEKQVDSLTDEIDDAVGDQEGVSDALRELEKAGKRHDQEGDDAFADALAGFDESVADADVSSETASPDGVAAGFDEPDRMTKEGDLEG